MSRKIVSSRHFLSKIFLFIFVVAITQTFLTSCVGSSGATVAPAVVNLPLVRYDMGIKINGQTFDGIGAVPLENKTYTLHLKSKVDLDRFTLRSCQREIVIDSAWNVEEDVGWFIFKHKKEKKNEITLEYKPSWIERRHCPIVFEAYSCGWNGKKCTDEVKTSTGMIVFFSPGLNLKAVVSCNGLEQEYIGGSHCQVKEGLEQSINFGESKVVTSPDASCDFGVKDGKYFQFKVKKGICAYIFKSESGQLHELVTLGYEQAFSK